jgi:hypothetical protein
METTALDRMADEGGLGVGELYFHLFKVKIGLRLRSAIGSVKENSTFRLFAGLE